MEIAYGDNRRIKEKSKMTAVCFQRLLANNYARALKIKPEALEFSSLPPEIKRGITFLEHYSK